MNFIMVKKTPSLIDGVCHIFLQLDYYLTMSPLMETPLFNEYIILFLKVVVKYTMK